MEVELDAVGKRFGRIRALAGVSARVAPRRRVALVGPNGSGKSTLIRALMGFLQVEGRIMIGGFDPHRHRVALSRRMAYVPQIAPQLFATVADIELLTVRARGLAPTAIEEMAVGIGLELAPIRRRSYRLLSGGMKQKLLIAMALAARAELLILDEPTASLDGRSREQFFRLFEEVAGTATLILCSHRLEEIRHLVDDVIALADGRVSYDGPAATLLARGAASLIELRVTGDSTWPRELGFVAGRGGWWVKRVARSEKIELLGSLQSHLAAGPIEDVVVRDVEQLELDEAMAVVHQPPRSES